MNFSIRPCSALDVDVLRRISIQTFRETFGSFNTPEDMSAYLTQSFSRERLLSELRNPNSFFFIVEDAAGKPLGYLKLNVGSAQTESMGSSYLEIQRIYVLTSEKHRGIGAALLRYSEDFARKRGLRSVWLGVWEKNQPAIDFYHKHNYHQTGDHTFQLGEDAQTDYVFEKRLD